jgi:hypothetical protein
VSWVGPLVLIGTLAAIVLGTLRLLAAHDRIVGRDEDGDEGGAVS